MAISNTSFAERLQRLDQRKDLHETRLVFHVGNQEVDAGARAPRKRITRSREIAGNFAYLMSIVGAFALGAIALVVGLFVRNTLAPMGADAEFDLGYLALSGVISLVIAFVLAEMFRITKGVHKTAQTIGIFIAISLIHNLAWWFPVTSTILFGEGWVQMQLLNTEPDTFKFRELVIALPTRQN